jgi:hypothetical protein
MQAVPAANGDVSWVLPWSVVKGRRLRVLGDRACAAVAASCSRPRCCGPGVAHESQASNDGQTAKLPARFAARRAWLRGSPWWQQRTPGGGLRSRRGDQRPPHLHANGTRGMSGWLRRTLPATVGNSSTRPRPSCTSTCSVTPVDAARRAGSWSRANAEMLWPQRFSATAGCPSGSRGGPRPDYNGSGDEQDPGGHRR